MNRRKQSLGILMGIMMIGLSACDTPVWIYLRNQSSVPVSIELKLLNQARFLKLPSAYASQAQLPIHAHSFAYEDRLLPIRVKTHRYLRQKINAQVISESHLRLVLPAHSTLYLGEPQGVVSYQDLKFRYAKVDNSGDAWPQEMQEFRFASFKKGGGSIFQGFTIYYDLF